MADSTGAGAAAFEAADRQYPGGAVANQHYYAHYDEYTRGGWSWDAESRTYKFAQPLPSEEVLRERYPPPSYIEPPHWWYQESYDQKQYRISTMQHNHYARVRRHKNREKNAKKLLENLGYPSCLLGPVMTRVMALPEDTAARENVMRRIIHQCSLQHKITSSLALPTVTEKPTDLTIATSSPGVPTDADTSSSSSPRGVGDADIATIIEECSNANADDKRIQMRWQPTLLLDCPECVHVLGQGVAGMVFAQSSVNSSRGGGTRTLIYFPPDATPPYDNSTARAALGDSKELLSRTFGPFRNREKLLGRETTDKHSLPIHHSSSMYDTLVLSDNGCCTSMIMWKIVRGSKAIWISWLATNMKYEGQGCGSLVLESVKAIAKGLGMEKMYLEVGVPSKMDDKEGRKLWAHARGFYDRRNFIVARRIPEEIGAWRMHGDDDSYEVLEFNLNLREPRKRKRASSLGGC